MPSIKVIDYGCGNLASVVSFFRNYDPCLEVITTYIPDVSPESILILPGVGSFRDGINSLTNRKLDQLVYNHVNNGGKILGICLGFQLLFSTGTEGGPSNGLDLIRGSCVSFNAAGNCSFLEPLPHVGFSSVHCMLG